MNIPLHKINFFQSVFSICIDSLQAGRFRDRILVGARFSAPVQTGPGANPVPYTLGTGAFPGVKRAGHGIDHQLHLAPTTKKE